jgi:hypothetical protein
MLRSEGSTLHSMFISVIIVQRVPTAPSPELKRPKREADHSPPSSAWLRMNGAIPLLPHMP